MKVRFISAFDYMPTRFRGRVLRSYPQGFEGTVKRECGEAAVAAGLAVELSPPPPPPEEPAPDAVE